MRGARGFTLPELLIATAITSVVIAVAFSGLLAIIRANDQNEDQIDRRGELNRALNFMATDIREATTISYTVPAGWNDTTSALYTPVFYLLKPPNSGGSQRAVGYYVRAASGVVWQGPRVVYRLEPTDTDNDLSNKILQQVGTKGDALIDAIIMPTTAICSPLPGALPVPSGRPETGLKAFIASDQVAKICIAGRVEGSDDLSLETRVFIRGRIP